MKPPKRPPKPPMPDSVRPHTAVVLSVDSGKKGGWAITVQGKLVQFGELAGYDYDSVLRVVRAAVQLGEVASMPCVLVLERPVTHRTDRSFGTILGLGASRGVWLAAWRGAGMAEKRIAQAPVNVWRRQILGRGWGSVASEVVRPHERLVAAQLVKRELGEAKAKQVGPDSAPAILIGQWGSRAGTVAKRLPKGAIASSRGEPRPRGEAIARAMDLRTALVAVLDTARNNDTAEWKEARAAIERADKHGYL